MEIIRIKIKEPNFFNLRFLLDKAVSKKNRKKFNSYDY